MPSSHVFVVDLSRHVGEAQQLVSAVLRPLQPYPGSTSLWYVRANQPSPPGLSTLSRVNGELPATTICPYIHQNSASGSVFHVLSYDTAVLRAASELNSDSAIVVPTYIRSFAYPEGSTAPKQSTTQGSLNFLGGPPLTFDEGVEIAKQVLQNGNYTSRTNSLLQSRLRFEMGPRATKNPLDPSSAFLIKNIVQDGVAKGWLSREGASGAETIWLTDGTPAPQVTSAPTAELSKALAEQPKPEPPKPLTRAALMEACLRSRGIGSPPAVRPMCFDAIQDIMSKKGKSLLSSAHLMRQSREQVVKQWTPSEAGKSPNWEAISVCILNMLLASGALIGDDGPLNDAIGGQSGNVVKLHPEFRDQSEAHLVFHIIEKMGDVTTSDRSNIGLALFQRGGGKDKVPIEDLICRVDTLLTMLQKVGKIDVEGDSIKAV